ncbi:MAG: class I SAM-dependent methyltransferase [Burkholderiaceae bacterium]|nr:class I SAM-dependent methyltransferase [Burkholderiaceae bacterium]
MKFDRDKIDGIIGAEAWAQWLGSDAGRYVLEWEKSQLDACVADLFGYVALQLGTPSLAALANNRMPSRALVVDAAGAQVQLGSPGTGTERDPGDAGRCMTEAETPPQVAVQAYTDALRRGPGRIIVERFDELPILQQSVDLVVLPHALDFAEDPHQLLREVERILRPEGRVVITGFNPVSLWGVHDRIPIGAWPRLVPGAPNFIALPRLRDWCKLLDLDIERGRYGCYRPPFRSGKWLARSEFFEAAGDRWWPICGAVYCVTAVKRVRAMRLIGPAWKSRRRTRAQVAVSSAQFDTAEFSAEPRLGVSARTCTRGSSATEMSSSSPRASGVPPATDRC